MNRRTIGFLSALPLLFYVQAGSASMSGARPEAAPSNSGIKLIQCGGYGNTECPGAPANKPTAQPTEPGDKHTETCDKTGYGVGECIESGDKPAAKSAKATAAPVGDHKVTCSKSGYGVAECADAGKQAGDQPPPSGAPSPGTSSPAGGSEAPGSPLQQCKLGCAPQCNAMGNKDLAEQCFESCEAKCQSTYGK